MADRGFYCVVVRHNLVQALRRVDAATAQSAVSHGNLEAATELARRFRENGCIDGDYHFDRADRAKVFAILCLDFAKALVEKRRPQIETLQPGADFEADSGGTPGVNG